jgi:FkbM family methyltransferase
MLGSHVQGVLVQSRNGNFLIGVGDQKIGRHLAYKGEYATDELNRLLSVLSQDSTLLVVGSHIGTLIVEASRHCRRAIAIEANPETFHFLELNLLINNRTNVQCFNVAASDRNETIPFVLNIVNSGGSKRLPKRHAFRYFYDSPTVVDVDAVPLDVLLRDESPDVILMDIEGSEYFALRGMPRILSGARVLILEFIPNHLKDVSGVTVEQFASTLSPYFQMLEIPSKALKVQREDFQGVLQEMYNANESDFGVIFTK